MKFIDYNGTGRWSLQAIQERYREYACGLQVSPLLDLTPRAHEQKRRRWIYPVMDNVIEGIERGDKACIEIGVEFIEEDERFPFGRILKSNTARALRPFNSAASRARSQTCRSYADRSARPTRVS